MQRLWLIWRPNVDEKLCAKIGLQRFDLAHLRRQLWLKVEAMTYADKRAMAEGGTVPRFVLLNQIILQEWRRVGHWERWLKYLDHTDQDVEEMERGEYPILPYLIRNFSALFGITVDFIMLGIGPVADPVGVNIEVWPIASGARV